MEMVHIVRKSLLLTVHVLHAKKTNSCLKPEGLDLAIWYVASPSGPLPSLFKLYPLGQKCPRTRGHMSYIGLFRQNMKKSSCLKPKGLEPLYLVCGIT